MYATNITVNPGGGLGRAGAPGRTMSSALGTRPVARSLFLSRDVNFERSQSPWGPATTEGAGPPAPVLAAALADPAGCGAPSSFPAAPAAAEPAAPLEDPFFTIFVAVARWRLPSLG